MGLVPLGPWRETRQGLDIALRMAAAPRSGVGVVDALDE